MNKKNESRKYLKEYEAELRKYQSLSRKFMGEDELKMVDGQIRIFKRYISNIKVMLSAK
ncbi:hypothetical protein [Acinetobacter pollinis]|uniref:Uncharacterized protein n=1 Tax=Acinetobacter pollinis TaxID=2605270 RepID=A0ABU6DQ26_9GAMM|nr:hypothetical protein [Acinetobacter pollinis]MEB5475965.1 hypothetical protein [Acinetobacter pollinis]